MNWFVVIAVLLGACVADAEAAPPMYLPLSVTIRNYILVEPVTLHWNEANDRLEANDGSDDYWIQEAVDGVPHVYRAGIDCGGFVDGFHEGSCTGIQNTNAENAFMITRVDFGFGYNPQRIMSAMAAGFLMAFVFFLFTDVLRFFWQSIAGRASQIADA